MIKTTPLLSLCLALVCTLTLNAQVTITAADFNIITQDSVTTITADTAGVIYPQGGQNVSWDYSVLTTQSSDIQGIGPNPANSAGSTLFPSANVLFGNPVRDAFVQVSSTRMEWLGSYYTNQPQPNYDLEVCLIYTLSVQPFTLNPNYHIHFLFFMKGGAWERFLDLQRYWDLYL